MAHKPVKLIYHPRVRYYSRPSTLHKRFEVANADKLDTSREPKTLHRGCDPLIASGVEAPTLVINLERKGGFNSRPSKP